MSKWIVVFQDFSQSYNAYSSKLEPKPPFLAKIEERELEKDQASRVSISYWLNDGEEITRKVNRACCSIKSFDARTDADEWMKEAAKLIGSLNEAEEKSEPEPPPPEKPKLKLNIRPR